jgi:phytoene dehydrogenase-like protein
MQHDVIVVGGGVAGLTAAAYLARAGASVLLCEKEKKVGGLVTSFERHGFVFDGGIRAIENSGIVTPMLKQLGISIEFLASTVSVGIGSDVIRVASKESLADYQALLERQFPENRPDIARIIEEVRRVIGYMDVLYGIDNPLFLDLMSDPQYIFRTILPWLLRYILTMPKVRTLLLPVHEHLAKLSGNPALIDIIDQHFFKDTPAYFALSYFTLYLDYRYPRGGTGTLSRKLEEYVLAHGGEIRTEVEIVGVSPGKRTLLDANGQEYFWRKLVWAADLKTLYRILDTGSIRNVKARRSVEERQAALVGKRGGDSVFTLYLALDIDTSYFSRIATAHFFYTPSKTGLSTLDLREIAGDPSAGTYTRDKARIVAWTRRFFELTSYEISCPALRDPALAPPGKTGLVVSTLMEHSLHRHVQEMGWQEEYEQLCGECIIEALDYGVFPGLKGSIIESFTSSPLTLEKRSGNADGAITGWAFTNKPMPAVSSLPAIAKSILTPIPDVYQAGQWTYSPSGVPISILTGKLAADKAIKDLG